MQPRHFFFFLTQLKVLCFLKKKDDALWRLIAKLFKTAPFLPGPTSQQVTSFSVVSVCVSFPFDRFNTHHHDDGPGLFMTKEPRPSKQFFISEEMKGLDHPKQSFHIREQPIAQ